MINGLRGTSLDFESANAFRYGSAAIAFEAIQVSVSILAGYRELV